MYYEDIVQLTNEQLIDQLRISSSPGAIDFELCSRELERRYLLQIETAVNRVDASSKRLERLTLWLIALTIALGLIALPPAIEAIARLL